MPAITQFSNDGLTFDVIDSGPADGKPVVLLHGFPQRAAAWEKVAAGLHDRGFRTIAPDQRGYSPGARPRGRKQYTVPRLADDVAALIDEIGQPVELVGHDWGAIVAWAVAAKHPDKVKSLTAVSVGHPAAFLRSAVKGQVLRSWYMFAFQTPALPERILSADTKQSRRGMKGFGMTDEMVDSFRRDIVDYGALPGGLAWYRALPFAPPTFVGRVAVPTTVVWSDRDAALGRAQAADSAKFVDGPFTFVEINGASHWLPEERPDEITAAILERIGS
ncbi:MAG: alpha/beta fold hydrolase [Gordonia sp. (in: high G+C Gram-positive bacteria)]|uniref:alpha/beta fold hydrolase n=1 Tax=Gordonia sp. (in: high G+C Gram-positive bacteria) TaxID=84139 RepID=UPI0039E39358